MSVAATSATAQRSESSSVAPWPAPARQSSCSWRPASSSATSARARSTRSRSASTAEHGVAADPANVFGLLSLIVLGADDGRHGQVPDFVMRADNPGRAASSRCWRWSPERPKQSRLAHASGRIRALVIFGAALLYGDGIITPAISRAQRRRGPRASPTPASSPPSCPDVRRSSSRSSPSRSAAPAASAASSAR